MKLRTKTLTIMSMLLVLCLVLTAFTGVSSAAKQYKISVVLKALNSDYWKTVAAGVNAAAAKYGVEVSIIGPSAETQVMEQFNMLQDQLTKAIDALVVAPLRPQATIPVFEQAKKANIPVLLIDTNAPWDDKVTFIGTGNYNAGKKAGEYFLKKMPKGGNVIIIRGAMGDATHDERTNGFTDVVKNSKIKVLDIQPADSERGKGMDVMQNLLQAHPNKINGVYCTNDEMALGALRAITTANIKKKIMVVGFDGSPDALKSIRDGGLTGTIKQDAYGIGYEGIEYAVKCLNGEKIEKTIDVPTIVVDKTNVKENIEAAEKIVGHKL